MGGQILQIRHENGMPRRGIISPKVVGIYDLFEGKPNENKGNGPVSK